LLTHVEYAPAEMAARASALFSEMARRRSVRHYADRPVPAGVIEDCLRTAATAPSGANLQPFHFVVITDPEVKRRIRVAAEAEEREFYEHRAPAEWLEALGPLGTGPSKPFLEVAPVLIAIFVKRYCPLPDGRQVSYPYAIHSAGLATGLLVAAIHHAGLVCLTHTPSHMGFLGRILQRPSNERAFLLLVVGYPAEDALVPDIDRKELDELATFV
jgi:nitroreductase